MHPSDGNTYAINKYLDEIDAWDARMKAEWPNCEQCDEATDPDFMNEDDVCDWCVEDNKKKEARNADA